MGGFLRTDCRINWSPRFCDLGNIVGVIESVIGFAAILPQIYKIWSFRSVEATSVLWPTCLVTASITHVFYVFATDGRTFFRVIAVYYPIIYLVFISAFWFFSTRHVVAKLSFAAGFAILWACILTIELSVSTPEGAMRLDWISVVAFSVSVFPQIVLNVNLRATSGQSSLSVLMLALLATLAFLRGFLLSYPTRYRVMMFMSCSLAYVNGVQVFWYPKYFPAKLLQQSYGLLLNSRDYASRPQESMSPVATSTVDILPNIPEAEPACETQDLSNFGLFIMNGSESSLDERKLMTRSNSSTMTSIGPGQSLGHPGYIGRLKEKPWWQLVVIAFLLSCVVLFSIALGVESSAFFSVLAPVSILLVLSVAVLHRDYKQGALQCANLRSYIQFKLFG